MKHFLNDHASIVTDAVDAEILLSGGRIRRLDGFPEIKVVVRADWNRANSSTVALVSGGGSGHEPAHAGFVGDGMLTAAVCGGVFASPSVDAVLAAIVSVTGPAGCLLVVKNYTGDRLNFGLAAERARALGLRVEMVIVADDVALLEARHPRGIAGTLFVHKVAGHVARAGGSLADVKAAAEAVLRGCASIGAAVSSCNIPGQPSENRIGPGEVELGLGIHGEPGARLVPLRAVGDLAAEMTSLVEAALDARGVTGGAVALLVNDLGGVPPIELAIAARALVSSIERHEVRLVFGPERLMTSLDMKGFSVSALSLADPATEVALLSAVGPRAWAPGRRVAAVSPLPLPDAIRATPYAASSNVARRRVVERICDTLLAKQNELDALDAKVGDGDTGTTLAGAARSLRAELDRLPFASPPELCAAISDVLARGVGGSSGILLAIFAAAMGAALAADGERPRWPAALAEGQRRLEEYGGAKPGDRTMLDALGPAIAALGGTGSGASDLSAAARAAADGAARTASMVKARAGRSSYVREDALRDVPDPGAVAVAAVFQALAAT